jgi:rhomboid protease GluP
MNASNNNKQEFPQSFPSNVGPSPTGSEPQRVAVKMPGVKPYVSYSLLGITIAVYILQEASTFMWGQDWPALLGLKVNDLIQQGEYWRLISPVLLHGSILHIAFNMYALSAFGPGLERFFGHWRFLVLYLLSGFAGNVMSFVFSAAPSLGSSTAIFGLLAAEGVFLYQNREFYKMFGRDTRRALTNILTVAGINLIIGLSPGIDNWGHIGGLLGGVCFAWFAGPVLHLNGNFPALTVQDQREDRQVILTGLITGLVFVAIVLATIMLRGG